MLPDELHGVLGCLEIADLTAGNLDETSLAGVRRSASSPSTQRGLTAAWSGRKSGEDAVGEWGAEALREHGSELEEQ